MIYAKRFVIGKMMLHNLLFYFENGKIELEIEVEPDKYTYRDILETCSKPFTSQSTKVIYISLLLDFDMTSFGPN